MQDLDKLLFLIEKKKFEEALVLSGELLQTQTQEVYIYGLHGLILIELGRINDGINVLNDGIYINPEYPDLYYYKSIALQEDGKYKEALKNINTALKIDSEEHSYYAIQGQIYVLMGNIKEAKKSISEGLRLSPENIDLRNLKTINSEADWDHDDAIVEAKDLLRIDPDNVVALTNLGNVYLKNGKNIEALDLHLKALSIDPEYDDAKQGLLDSLKNKVFLYRWIYRCQLLIQKFQDKAAGVFVMAWIFLKPFRIVMAVIIYLYLMLYHIFNFGLIFHKLGGLALNKIQYYSSIAFVVFNSILVLIGVYGYYSLNINYTSLFLFFIGGILLISSPLQYYASKLFFIYFVILGGYFTFIAYTSRIFL